jgi:glycosyltransferase involved in cell wall biosynthesis
VNLVMVSDYFYPDAVGGTWNYAHDLAQRLAARGHRCFCIGAHPGDGRLFRERVGAIEFHRYRLRRAGHGFSFASRLIGSYRSLREIARQHSVDVLHTHMPMGAVGACLAARSTGARHVATMHGTGMLSEYLCEVRPQRRRGDGPLYCVAINALERWYLRRARRLVALSRFSRDAFVCRHGLDPEQVAILPPGVDLERFRPGPREGARRRLGLPLDRPIVLTVRRLTPRMGLDRLIRAVRLIADRIPECLLLIGGKGPWRPQLERLIAELGLEENVRLLGFIPDETLPLYYQAVDLFVIPSIAAEGFGLVSLDALACDLPVLGTPAGGIVEVLSAIDPELLFPDTSPEAMAPHILTWLERVRRSGSSPQSFSYRARVAEHFNWDTSMERLEALFEEVRNP